MLVASQEHGLYDITTQHIFLEVKTLSDLTYILTPRIPAASMSDVFTSVCNLRVVNDASQRRTRSASKYACVPELYERSLHTMGTATAACSREASSSRASKKQSFLASLAADAHRGLFRRQASVSQYQHPRCIVTDAARSLHQTMNVQLVPHDSDFLLTVPPLSVLLLRLAAVTAAVAGLPLWQPMSVSVRGWLPAAAAGRAVAVVSRQSCCAFAARQPARGGKRASTGLTFVEQLPTATTYQQVLLETFQAICLSFI